MLIEDTEASSEETGSTATTEESASQTESTAAESQEAAPVKKEETSTPFHEHPRFKELIDERRAYKEQLDQTKGYMEALQKEMQALRTAQPKPVNEPKYKPLIDELKTINPVFAESYQEMLSGLETAREKAALAEKLQERLNAYEEREIQTQAVTRLNTLLDSNKISGDLRKRYEREIQAIAQNEVAQTGKKLSVQDVDRLFQAVHTDYTPFLESVKRDTLKGYVKEKKQDAAPSSTTGGAPAVSKGKKAPSMDTEEGMQAAVKWFADQRRAAKKL